MPLNTSHISCPTKPSPTQPLSHHIKGASIFWGGSMVDNAGSKMMRQLKVLVVEDSQVQSMILSKQLSSMGVQVKVVEDGQKAVDLHLAGASYDVIFIDNEMPVVSGPQATRKLRSMGVRSKIIGVTANDHKKDMEEFMSAGLDTWYGKPITAAAIASILKEIDMGN